MAWAVIRSDSHPPSADATFVYRSCTVCSVPTRSVADSLILSAYSPMSESLPPPAIFFSALIWLRIVFATELRWLTSSVTWPGSPGVGSSSRPSGRQAAPVGRPIRYHPCPSLSLLLRALAQKLLCELLVGIHELLDALGDHVVELLHVRDELVAVVAPVAREAAHRPGDGARPHRAVVAAGSRLQVAELAGQTGQGLV